jgi:hypothetical protein
MVLSKNILNTCNTSIQKLWKWRSHQEISVRREKTLLSIMETKPLGRKTVVHVTTRKSIPRIADSPYTKSINCIANYVP